MVGREGLFRLVEEGEGGAEEFGVELMEDEADREWRFILSMIFMLWLGLRG